MDANAQWIPSFPTEDFDQRMENAFRRVSGSIGFDLAMDRGNTKALKASASSALETGLDRSAGPLFLRAGMGVLEMAGYRPSAIVDVRASAGEILREFFEEGSTAYHAAAAGLRVEARCHLEAAGLSEEDCRAVLSSAESSFVMPSREEFTRMGEAVCQEGMTTLTKATLAGGVVFVAILLLVRNPVFAGIAGVAAGGAAYYFARAGRRQKVERLVRTLPKRLYETLHAGLKTNLRRYAEVVNAAAARKGTDGQESD